jgi:outer membrane protein assembly factor BamB
MVLLAFWHTFLRITTGNKFGLLLAALMALALPAGLFAQEGWSVNLSGIGTFSSPRVADLNGDRIGDIILGAGGEELKRCDSAVFALDGRTGKILWLVNAIDQVFGSAALLDITKDSVQDVFIGGRSAEFMAIDGKTGVVLWRFDKKHGKDKWYGFYNAQFITDQDGDGLEDVLTSNGGNNWAEPHDERKRPPGKLVILSSKSGKLIAEAKMPDGKETYMSVSALRDGGDYRIIFGTGGETVGGHLYVSTLSQVAGGDLSKARLLDSSPANGYVAPAVWVDINEDNVLDVIANAVEGKLIAFDGKTYQPLWSVTESGTEAYSSIAPGLFTNDKIPDFFVSYAVGKWPKLEWSRQLLVDGATGKTIYTDSLGFYQTSTPVVVDIDGDGTDEAIMSVNIHIYDEINRRELHNMLVAIDFKKNEVVPLTEMQPGSNISTTPWIGDLDQDGFMDIIYCHSTDIRKTYTFNGMRVSRVETQIPMRSKITWGAYMGSKYDGVFRK